MKISAVMAIYNGREYIYQQLSSIEYQSKKVDELIIIDDCSFDVCDDIIEEFKNNSQMIITYIKHKVNMGYAQTFFEALDATNADYIFLVDQDDIWEKNKVSKMIEIMERTPKCLCLSSLNTIINESNKILKEERKFGKREICKINCLELLLQKKLRPGMSLLISKEHRNKVISYDISNLRQHDRFIEFVAAIEEGFYIVNERLTRYRIHGGNTSGMNLSFAKLRSNMTGRYMQIENEIKYLNVLKSICDLDDKTIRMIDEIIKFYATRKKVLKEHFMLYPLWAVSNLKYYSTWKIILGDIFAKLKE